MEHDEADDNREKGIISVVPTRQARRDTPNETNLYMERVTLQGEGDFPPTLGMRIFDGGRALARGALTALLYAPSKTEMLLP